MFRNINLLLILSTAAQILRIFIFVISNLWTYFMLMQPVFGLLCNFFTCKLNIDLTVIVHFKFLILNSNTLLKTFANVVKTSEVSSKMSNEMKLSV